MSWAEVKKVNSDLSVPLNEKINSLQGLIEAGVTCVKSVQQMRCILSPNSTEENITIAPINVKKAICIVAGQATNEGYCYVFAYAYIESPTSICIKRNASTGTVTVSVEVIEFY